MAYDGALYESELLVIRLAQARLNKETFEKRSADLEAELVGQKDLNKDSAADLAIFEGITRDLFPEGSQTADREPKEGGDDKAEAPSEEPST